MESWRKEYVEEKEDFTEKELMIKLMDQYVNLQRIKNAADREREIDYQIQITKAELDIFGVPADILETLKLK